MADGVIGVGLALASAGCYDAGYLLEKGALSRVPSLTSRSGAVRMLAGSPQWVVGAVAMLGGLALRFVALTVAPVGVVQPVLVGGTVAIVPAARLFLGERVTRWEAAAICTLVLGVVAVALGGTSGGSVEPHAQSAVALALMVAAALAVGAAMRGGIGDGRSRVSGVICVGLCYGTGAIAEKGVAERVSAHGLVEGLGDSLTTVDPWLFVLATALGLVLFQLALQRQPVSVLVPASNGLSSAWAVLGAVAVFSERWPHAASARGALTLGYCSLALGVVILHRLGADARPAGTVTIGAARPPVPDPGGR